MRNITFHLHASETESEMNWVFHTQINDVIICLVGKKLSHNNTSSDLTFKVSLQNLKHTVSILCRYRQKLNLICRNVKGMCIQVSYDANENYLRIDINEKQLLSSSWYPAAIHHINCILFHGWSRIN